MKKVIFIDVLLIATFISCIISIGLSANITNNYWESYGYYFEYLQSLTPSESVEYIGAQMTVDSIYSSALQATFSLLFSFLAALTSITCFLLFNKGRKSEIKTMVMGQKEQAQSTKASRAESRKAAKIAKLEQELETLKKDGD